MPQQRTLLAADARVRFERVQSHAATGSWSPAYRPPACRIVFPAAGALSVRTQEGELLVDGLTALRLPAAAPYQLRPQASAHGPAHVVLSEVAEHALAQAAGGAAWLLAPAHLFRLRLLWKRLAAGGTSAGEAAGIATRGLGTCTRLHAARAGAARVLRARAFLAGEGRIASSLSLVCEAACTSPFHLARVFRQHTGLGLHRYRLHLRMAAALARLEEGERDLSGLAHDLGFSSHSHFGAAFRAEVGVTPTQARQAFAGAHASAAI